MTTHTDSQNAADFYDFEGALSPEVRKVLVKTREFMRDQVAPLVAEHWAEGVFPKELIGRFRESGLVGLPYEGYGDHGPVASHLLTGPTPQSRTSPTPAASPIRATSPVRCAAT
ncbi:acyl-CoA dehydrogenase family protein [Streptomyces chartreusis]|uniref:acyl-CoA dehydrogenase family protein n=1 Tax=Streptomyces chartreusis TaxID=1969 RepID=UPI00123DBBEE|nr:acyl-CoA dehydrogenase family protein [Streptomyces chartreusis]QEV65316.1 hypothetical protein CP983_00395 [Streptomyces chartreusis]GGW91515.1 hypothetical protein GCM10010321_00820 [Streptomyces chartreusis]